MTTNTLPPRTTAPTLRFLTAGSVDDGKSTLIGRLLLDTRTILADQLAGLKRRSDEMDLALLTDGLEAEREQGITIDVAYRYFAIPERKFIIADAPGHEQYTRNMVTAASSSDAAVILVDATKLDWQAEPVELLPQTRRHTLLAHLLRVTSIVFAINKLDAIDDAATAYQRIKAALEGFARQAGIPVAGIVPISALKGANVADGSDSVPAIQSVYEGPTLLELLSGLPATPAETQGVFHFPVQWVEKPRSGTGPSHAGRRVFWGRIATGSIHVGDTVTVLPSGKKVQVAHLARTAIGPDVAQAHAGESVGITLDAEVDVSRGDWFAGVGAAPLVREATATLAWLDDEPLVVGRAYWLKHGHRWVKARVTAIEHQLDIQTLEPRPAQELGANGIGRVRLAFQQPLPLLPYSQSRELGACILVDAATNQTSGAAMIAEVDHA